MSLELAWADTRHHRVDLVIARGEELRVVTGTPSARQDPPYVPLGWEVVLQISVPPNSGQHMVVVEEGRLQVRRLNGFTAWPSARAIEDERLPQR